MPSWIFAIYCSKKKIKKLHNHLECWQNVPPGQNVFGIFSFAVLGWDHSCWLQCSTGSQDRLEKYPMIPPHHKHNAHSDLNEYLTTIYLDFCPQEDENLSYRDAE